MKVCFPVLMDEGMSSIVYSHFGSAPLFMIIDTDTYAVSSITNQDQQHAEGACNPLKALDNQKVDAIVVGGIGAGALAKLTQLGITVHRSQADTIRENLDLLKSPGLPVMKMQGCCGSHGHGHGHGGHGHSHGGGCAHHSH